MKHLSARISNIKEHILFYLFNKINDHVRFVVIEGDTTVPDELGDWPACNSAITISYRIYEDIMELCCPNVNDKGSEYTTLTYRDAGNYCFAINPLMEGYTHHPILSPIQYDPKWHTFGFQPVTPSVISMLFNWKKMSDSHLVLPVSKSYDDTHQCYFYSITNPSDTHFWWKPFEWIIWRNIFRYPDKRKL